MKPSKILRKAAHLAEERRKTKLGGGCFCINNVGQTLCGKNADANTAEAETYFRLFMPTKSWPFHSYWFGAPANCSKKLHARRVLALLFAADIAESEGR